MMSPTAPGRAIPGRIPVVGREYWYIEAKQSINFNELFVRLVKAVDPPLYTKGGALTGGCELTLPDGRKFHAMSFKGDLDGWREQITAGVNKLRIEAGQIVEGRLLLLSGDVVPLEQCGVRFY
jgi:hypothetical protein